MSEAQQRAERPPRSTPGAEYAEDRIRRPRRRRIHSSDVWLFLVFAVILVLFLSGWHEKILEVIYGKVALVILAVMLVEYLVLKARDRSRFYRLQLHMINNRRREDLCVLRETRDSLGLATERFKRLRRRIEAGEALADDNLDLFSDTVDLIEQTHQDICNR
jgi:hypothetical protein